jgi:hypothetical protein
MERHLTLISREEPSWDVTRTRSKGKCTGPSPGNSPRPDGPTSLEDQFLGRNVGAPEWRGVKMKNES